MKDSIKNLGLNSAKHLQLRQKKSFSRKTFALNLRFLILLSVLISFQKINADIFYSEKYGYYMDLPEAYTLTELEEDETSIFFTHDFLPLSFAVKIYESFSSIEKNEENSKKTTESILKKVLTQIKSPAETASVIWNEKNCAVASLSFSLGNIKNTGYAAAIPLAKNNSTAVLLCYTPQEYWNALNSAVTSTIDSFMPDRKSFMQPGIITTLAYPETYRKKIQLTTGGKNITTEVDAEAGEAANFVVNREYNLLLNYATHPLGKQAFCRYYRMIYKDSYSRLNQVAKDLYRQLFPEAIKKNAENPEHEYIQMLLNWVQNFEYERTPSSTDFTDLISAITSKGSDCDTRSMLLCILAKQAGINSAFFLSTEYSHAIAGFDIEGSGARLKGNSTDFLLGETTAKNLNLGLINQDMADSSKWTYIELP